MDVLSFLMVLVYRVLAGGEYVAFARRGRLQRPQGAVPGQRALGIGARVHRKLLVQIGSLPPMPAEVGGLAPKGDPRDSPVGNSQDEFQFLRGHVQRALAPEIAKGDAAVRNTPDGLVISLREVGFFDSGSAGIRPSSLAAFERLAKVLAETPSDIRIEGHTDNVPIHNARFASNWDLSTARATTTVRLLVTNYGFDPRRLAAAGYAEYRPIANNGTAVGRALNRRVDIVVPRKGSVLSFCRLCPT